MKDPMEQLRSAQPMPRGERLARNRNVSAPKPHRLIQRCGKQLAMAWFIDDVEAHAAPLALARERRRRERAEQMVRVLRADLGHPRWRHDQAESALAEARAEVARLRADVIEYEAQMHAARGEATERLAQSRHWREQAKAAEAEVLRVRAMAPTREDVERAVDALLEARRRAVEATPRTVHGAFDALSAARDALVALATRGRG